VQASCPRRLLVQEVIHCFEVETLSSTSRMCGDGSGVHGG
jgi:hypothetical protein